METDHDLSWVTKGLTRPSQKYQPVDDSYLKPPPKVTPSTLLKTNLEGARTDSELNAALLAHKGKTVVVKYGSSFCYHCQQMLPHFLKISNEYPQNHYVVAQLDHMKDAAQGIKYTPTYAFFKHGLKVDQFVAYEAQQLDDHIWLQSESR
ncbi:hypothetical protein WJX74_000132 [Apatococcus lobatus]|uniref:Thioredoxin domain-containing protein n=2 Tax=Apatococcus TaxID=904362 RepID=A0AAW1T4G9_9CHLO